MKSQGFPRAPKVLAGVLVATWAAFVRGLGVVEALHAPFLGKYPRAAQALLAGELPPERWLDFSPLYLGLAALLEATGSPVRESLLILQAAAGVVASLVAFALARRWGGPAAGVAAGLLVGSARMVVVGGALLEPEIFLGLGLLAGTWLISKRDRPSIPYTVAAGLCFAIAALVRPNALVVPALLFGLALVFTRRWVRPTLLAAAVSGVGLVLGLSLWLGPRVPLGDWSALMSPGQVFYQGNARDASGFGLHHPLSVRWAAERFAEDQPDFEHQAYRDVARAQEENCLRPPQAEAFWRSLAWDAIKERPGSALQRAGARFVGTLHRRQVWDVDGAARLEARLAWPAPVEMPVLLPLALVAFVLPGRRRLLFLLPILILPFLTSTVFFASGRHRLLLDLALAVAAGVGVARLVDRFRGRVSWTPRQAVGVLVVLVLGVLLPFLAVDAVERNRALVALDGAARRNAHLALEAWDRNEVDRAEELAAGAVVLDVGLAGSLPEALRGRSGFRSRARDLARELVLGGKGGVTPRAAAALVQLAGCPALETALAVRSRRGPEIDPAFRQAVTLLAAGCELRGGSPGEALATLDRMASKDELTLRGHAFRATARLLEPSPELGRGRDDALSAFPAFYDLISIRLALAEALRVAGREGEARGLETEVTTELIRVPRSCLSPSPDLGREGPGGEGQTRPTRR